METIIINLGDDLKNAKLNLPKSVPVTKNFDNTNIIGNAEVLHAGENIIAHIEINDKVILSTLPSMIDYVVAGKVTERDRDLITKFEINSISITPNGSQSFKLLK